jgi:hypothetical protein
MAVPFLTSTPILTIFLVISLFTSSAQANVVNSFDDWLHDYKGNGTLKEEIQCYALPYGGIGFTSHILTYYAVAMLARGRSPWTLHKNTRKSIDLTLSLLGLIATFIVSVLTIIRCRSRWQFILLAVWKMVLSVSLGCLSVHAATLIGHTEQEGGGDEGEGLIEMSRKDQSQVSLTPSARRRKSPARVLWWMSLYVPGVIVGMIGLLSLVFQEIKHNMVVEHITLVFGTVIATFAVLTVAVVVGFLAVEGDVGALSAVGYSSFGILVSGFGAMAFMGALYSDWILGAIAGNLAGAPSSDNAALYWTYFIAKRLPFFSF